MNELNVLPEQITKDVGTVVQATGPRTIRRYANRKLYDTTTSSYITLDNLVQLVKQDVEVVVLDHSTGGDITSGILARALFELQERNGFPSVDVVRGLIKNS